MVNSHWWLKQACKINTKNMDINFKRRHMSVPPHITAGQNVHIHVTGYLGK